ncbi:MAG: type VI secretion system contractile sheath large subunit [Rhodopila sp.]|jgi:type VI secretion system protein ImpD/type VI secretion system protein ImpC
MSENVIAHADASGTDRAATPLRNPVLAGGFVGSDDKGLGETFSEFLTAADAAALDLWFGPDRAVRFGSDPMRLRGALDRDIAAIDAMLSEQLDTILHHPRLTRIEGSWRGLHWLVSGSELSARLKIKVLNIGWPEICRDLDLASEFDQSYLFRKIYEEEFGSPGGEPYGLLIIDHEVRHRAGAGSRTDDVSALASLSSVAAAAFSPVIMGAAPALLEVDAFQDLANVIDITSPLRNGEHARWRGLSTRSDMRFVGVALPRMLARLPWQDDGTRDDGFRYAEYAPGPEHRVWSNAAYAFAAVAARAFAAYAWPADVRGVETDRVGGGLVQHVPVEPFDTDRDQTWTRIPLEIVWNDRQERELLSAGLIPLAAIPNTEDLVFGAVRSLLSPARHTGPAAPAGNANARISSQINTILCASRFAHHLKMMGRQMVGSFRTADEIERQLQGWLTRYVNGNLSAGGESRARHPLVAGQVEVREIIGKPGSFGCIVRLQPHYQLDDVTATFQLATEIGGGR